MPRWGLELGIPVESKLGRVTYLCTLMIWHHAHRLDLDLESWKVCGTPKPLGIYREARRTIPKYCTPRNVDIWS